jgi:hypothetical protein
MTNCNGGGKLTDLLQRIEKNGEWISEVITMDECWGFQFAPDIKRQSIQWKLIASACPKWMSKSKVKTISIYFDCKGMVYWKFAPPAQTFNQSSISKLWNVWDRVSLFEARIALWQVDPAPWQPALIHSTLRQRVFGGKIDHRIPLTHQVLLHVTPFSLLSRIISRDHILILWKEDTRKLWWPL